MDKMDFVYICKPGDNEELRYSIRSVVANFPNSNVWVVGGRPEWYLGSYVAVEQDRTKYTNARNNLKAIVNTPEISERFVLMNDDFYILNPVDEIPYMHGGLLQDKIDKREESTGRNGYTALLKQTMSLLQQRRLQKPILNYELHVPMVMEKSKLRRIVLGVGLWRSMYGNLADVGGIEMQDVKVYADISLLPESYDINNLTSDYLSSDDSTFDIIHEKILSSRFPTPSVYEK